jgi:DNA-binding Lrp family transcriptional regulator
VKDVTLKLTVFLCSTFADLSEERQQVLDAVRELKLQYDSMEFFGAEPSQPLETCLRKVRSSDILVVIVGHRYGSIVPGLDISYTEAEYQEGFRLTKPCLIYMRDENVRVLPRHVERDAEKLHKLERWKKQLQDRHTVANFTDSSSLAERVRADLLRTMQAQDRSPGFGLSTDASTAGEVARMVQSALDTGLSHSTVLASVRRAISSLTVDVDVGPPSVFLSYSHSDKQVVRDFADLLKKQQVRVWRDEDAIQVGDSLVEKIQYGLNSADFVAFFISKSSLSSEWARRELDIAISKEVLGGSNAKLVPILLDDVEIPAVLRNVMYLDLRDRDVAKAVNSFMQSIQFQSRENIRNQASRSNHADSSLRAFVLVKLSRIDALRSTQDLLEKLPEVLEIRTLLGGVDLLLDASFPSMAHASDFVRRLSNMDPSIQSTQTFVQCDDIRGRKQR